jgi:UPF0716 protein FxsA
MRFLFSVAAIALPILDIATLVQVGGWLGAWPTAGMVLLAAIIGLMLVRAQGLAILTQARDTLNRGSIPTREVFDGACVLIGGALLVLPGFASDLLGAVLLAPPARSLLRRLVAHAVRRSGRFANWTMERQPTRQPGDGPTIAGEFEPVQLPDHDQTEDDDLHHHRSPWHR